MFDNRFWGAVAAGEAQRTLKAARRRFFLTAISRLGSGFTTRDVEAACLHERVHGADYGLNGGQYPQTYGTLLRELIDEGVLRVTQDPCRQQRNLYWWVGEDSDEADRTEEDDILDEWAGVKPVIAQPRKKILDKESQVCFTGVMDTIIAPTPRTNSTGRLATFRRATDRQIRYLTSLDSDMRNEFPDRVLDDDGHSDIEYELKAHQSGVPLLSVEKASELIDWCIKTTHDMRRDRALASLEASAPRPKLEITEGFWYLATAPGQVQIVKIQRAVHGSGNLYGKRLLAPESPDGSKWKFEFESGLIRQMVQLYRQGVEVAKLTPERAKEFGHLYGICCVCGATLTDEKSIAAGIGPVCGRRI